MTATTKKEVKRSFRVNPQDEFETLRSGGRIERVDGRELLRGPTASPGDLRPTGSRDSDGSQDRPEDQRG